MPAGQGVHADAPAKEYCPTGQMEAVADVDPAGQVYPAEQSPEQVDKICPGPPYRPAAQGPEQAADARPVVLPYVPAGHCAVQDALVSPAVEPNVPAGHSVQLPAPAKLYLPTAHTAAVGLVDPAAHAYPAVHDPLHAAVGRVVELPNNPAAQAVQVPDPAVL